MKDELNRPHNGEGVVHLLQSELSYSTRQYCQSRQCESSIKDFLYILMRISHKKALTSMVCFLLINNEK